MRIRIAVLLLLASPAVAQLHGDGGSGWTEVGITGEVKADKLILTDNNAFTQPEPNVLHLYENNAVLSPNATCANQQAGNRMTIIDADMGTPQDWTVCRGITLSPTEFTKPTLTLKAIAQQGRVFEIQDAAGNELVQVGGNGGIFGINNLGTTSMDFNFRSLNKTFMFNTIHGSDCLNIHTSDPAYCDNSGAVTAMEVTTTAQQRIGSYVNIADTGGGGVGSRIEVNVDNAGGGADGISVKNGGTGKSFQGSNNAGGVTWYVDKEGNSRGLSHITRDSGTLPTCNAAAVGTHAFAAGGNFEIDDSCDCMQDAQNAYTWICDGQMSFVDLEQVNMVGDKRLLYYLDLPGAGVRDSNITQTANSSWTVTSIGETESGIRIQASDEINNSIQLDTTGILMKTDNQISWTADGSAISTPALKLNYIDVSGDPVLEVTTGISGKPGVKVRNLLAHALRLEDVDSGSGNNYASCTAANTGEISYNSLVGGGTTSDEMCACLETGAGVYAWVSMVGGSCS